MTANIDSKASKKRTLYYIHSFITIFFMFGFGYIKPFGGLTEYGMHGLAVLLGVFWGWTFVDIFWPSVLAFVALGYWGAGTSENLNYFNMNGLGANVPLIILFVGIFARYLTDAGLVKYLAEWFISRKIAAGRPFLLVWLIIVCCHILSGIVATPYPIIILLWNICYEIADHMGYEKKCNQMAFIIGSVVVGGAYGSYCMPWDIASLAYAQVITTTMPDVHITFLSQLIVYNVWAFIGITLYVLAAKYILRVDLSVMRAKGDHFSYLRDNKMNAEQRRAMIMLVAFLILAVYANSAPDNWPLSTLMGELNAVGFAMIAIAIIGMMLNKNGDPIYSLENLFVTGMPWASYLLIASTFPICAVLENSESGVINVVSNLLLPTLGGLSPFMSLFVFCSLIAIATQISHNFVLGMTFIPLLGPVMYELGVDPHVWVFAMGMILSTAFITPACSSTVAMFYSNKEWTTPKQNYQFMIIAFITCYIVFLIVTPMCWIYWS